MILLLWKSELYGKRRGKFRAYGKMTRNGDELCENGRERDEFGEMDRIDFTQRGDLPLICLVLESLKKARESLSCLD